MKYIVLINKMDNFNKFLIKWTYRLISTWSAQWKKIFYTVKEY